MKKWKRIPIALVVLLLLGCASVNAQTSDEYDESDWIAQHKLGIEEHGPNETFSANGVDKAQMNVVIRNNATGDLAKAPFNISVVIHTENGVAKPQNVTIFEGEAISEEITLTTERPGSVTVTATADDLEAVTSVEFTTPHLDPREILLEPYCKGKPILANESIWAGEDKEVTLRVKLLDKNGQPMYFSSKKHIDISPSEYPLEIPIYMKYYGEINYKEDVQGTVKITAGSDDFRELDPVTIEVTFATDPRSLCLETLRGEWGVIDIPADAENVTLRVSLRDEMNNSMIFPSNKEISIETSKGENIDIDILTGNSSREISYPLENPGTIKFTAKSKNFKLNATTVVKFAVPSEIKLRALYENELIMPENPVPVGGDKNVILKVELLKNGARIDYPTPRRISISINGVDSEPIDFPPGVGELPRQEPGTVVDITARSDEFSELEPATIEVNFTGPSNIGIEAYSDGKLITHTDSILAHGFENVTLEVSILDKNTKPINFTYKDTVILISTNTMKKRMPIIIPKGQSYGVRKLPQQKPGIVNITARSDEFSGLEPVSIEVKFIYGAWMMIYAALGGFVIYFLKGGGNVWSLIAHASFGLLAYLLFCFGASFETPIDISSLPIGSPFGAFLIGIIGGLALMAILWVPRHL